MTYRADHERHWFEKAFGSLYLELYGHRDEWEAQRAVGTLLSRLIPPGTDPRAAGPVLDIACGPGRHLKALAASGVSAFGIDLSWPLLREAGGSAGRLVRGDMRSLPFRDGSMGCALSMFTSFGYFPTVEENRAVLAEAQRVLRPGGLLVLDYLNSTPTLAGLVPVSRRTIGRYEVVEKRATAPAVAPGRESLVKTTEIREGPRTVDTLVEEVLLFTARELVEMVLSAGFRIEDRFGGYDGEPFDAEASSRVILLARREPR